MGWRYLPGCTRKHSEVQDGHYHRRSCHLCDRHCHWQSVETSLQTGCPGVRDPAYFVFGRGTRNRINTQRKDRGSHPIFPSTLLYSTSAQRRRPNKRGSVHSLTPVLAFLTLGAVLYQDGMVSRCVMPRRAVNGEIVGASSEGYSSQGACEANAQRIGYSGIMQGKKAYKNRRVA